MKKTWFFRRNQKFFLRHYSSKRRQTVRFDLLNLGLAVTIILSALMSWGQSCELSQANSAGFTLWFLMFLAYLPLELLCLLDWCTAGDLSWLMEMLFRENQAVGLGCFNLFIQLVIWGVVRFLAVRKFGENLLRIANHIMLIFLVWGCFQLCCSVVMRMWEYDGISVHHTYLKAKK